MLKQNRADSLDLFENEKLHTCMKTRVRADSRSCLHSRSDCSCVGIPIACPNGKGTCGASVAVLEKADTLDVHRSLFLSLADDLGEGQ